MEEIDRSGTNRYNAIDIGNAVFDDALDMAAPGFQEAYLGFCSRVRTWDYVQSKQVFCPVEEFKVYVEEELGEVFPVPAAEFEGKLAEFVAWYEVQAGPAPEFSESSDSNGRMYRRQGDQSLYNAIRFRPPTDADVAAGVAPKIAYLMTVVNMTLSYSDTALALEPAYDAYVVYMAAENARPEMVAATLGKGLQQSWKWVDYELETVLLSSALLGIGASLGVAALIILLSTGSVVLTVLSVVSIGGIVASLIGCLVWMGWKMSLLESICLTILVGLAVDYSIHLANAWVNAQGASR